MNSPAPPPRPPAAGPADARPSAPDLDPSVEPPVCPPAAPPAAPLSETSAKTPETVSLIVPAQYAGDRVDQALAGLMPDHSRSRLQQWIRSARVLMDGRPVRASDKVWGGESLMVSPDTDRRQLAATAEAIALSIVHEDASVIVLDKPAGLVVHPGSGNWQGTLLNALLHHYPPIEALPRAGIVHRLDKDTSGLMMVAKTLTAHTALVRALAARDVERTYNAIVLGDAPVAGEIDRPVGRHPVQRTRMAVVERGRPALTRYRLLERLAGASLVECRLATGRTHQIRVHLESIGHPVLGDPVYAPRANRLPPAVAAVAEGIARQALHAVELAFVHPENATAMRFRSPLPADIEQALARLRRPA